MSSLPETTDGIVVFCLPGALKARVVVAGEDGNLAARTLSFTQLVELRLGIDEALKRTFSAHCDRHCPAITCCG